MTTYYDESQVRPLVRSLYESMVSEWGRAKARIESVGWYTDNAVYDAWVNAMNQAGKVLGKLAPEGSLTNRLWDGTLTFEAWKEQAITVTDTIRYVLKETGSAPYTFGRLWDEVVVPTVKETGELAQKVTGQFFDIIPWVAAALIALVIGYLAFVVVKVLA